MEWVKVQLNGEDAYEVSIGAMRALVVRGRRVGSGDQVWCWSLTCSGSSSELDESKRAVEDAFSKLVAR
jgi:hypothetical protein